MKTALIALSLILGASTVQASTTIASCIGSYEQGRYGEIYTISREGNKLLVAGQYDKSPTASFNLNSKTVKKDTATAFQVKSSSGWAFSKKEKSLWIDFTSGEGVFYTYAAFESLLKGRTIYLSSCTR